MSDPRTHVDMMSDLLAFMVDHAEDEFPDSVYVGGDEWSRGCAECDAASSRGERQHADGCKYPRIIEEARAFLRAENALREARDEDPVRVP